ncbi:ATP-binding cassette domain-containing protein [Acinetobacter nosocomialis]|uniref:ATP-binding cassette domain-containing protein n=1 Tax=Acinetobacter nosocomialis TaxID=106654 RepID=UPI000B3E1AA6|nr:ATP-binding cassette domain-containing protein [Acinetobacter nosocomialis]MBD0443458.1 ABC transporter ATP-binding protein [Acinetobacter nosocomialis]MDQ9039045.1 ATP-binding cassette domain-containing protein [Acinetobacter nosocomialis]MDR9531758.1 ATP-binding cassette domain-containing protein [Acinetobacter nosocomialis]OUT28548.1 ABC transporter ATP-binding protein [Acinetobacter nosocomialis P020]PSE14468.1 ABC transporter ATP-binding protein [Acinetobacter nosocomialis]
MTDNNVVVQAHNLSMAFKAENKKSAEIKAINDLNMQIKKGELTALVGPDGSGKTTLLRLIAGLYKATSGSLNVLGFDIDKNPQAVQDLISYMPQRFGLYEDLSVQENLNLYADLHGVPKDVRSQRFKRLLEITDLTQFIQRPAGKLSGGMKQKLGLACTLVRSPELLLLDEPSVGVDPLSRRDLWTIIEQLVQEENLSVIISTAYMDEAEKCDYVYIMYEGKILKQGSPEQLKEIAHGQTWKVKLSEQIKARTLQAQLLGNSVDIIDAVPKGEQVNFISRQKELSTDILPQGLVAHRRSAELEDAFMMLLQQTQKQRKHVSVPEQNFQLEQNNNLKSQQPVIVVKDLVRTFGDFTAVANTSFDVKRGEIFGLLGPNGAGKTTTFRMLCGLLPASSGYLEVAGKNLRTARAEARGKVGYVSQKFALYSNLTVLENLKFFGGAYGLTGKKLNQQIDNALEQYDLKPHIKSGDLPGGYKQRLSMAAALLHEPEILFLDEPTSGIDPLARRSFWYSIGELANQGITIIITTHFMEEAEYCDRIAIQDAGKLLALGSPQQVRDLASRDKHIGDMNEAFIAIVEQARALRHAV